MDVLNRTPTLRQAVSQSNPFVGTWRLNLAASTFDPGPPPRSQTRTWAADGTVSVEGVTAAGQPVAYEYSIKADGREYAATGAVPGSADRMSSTRTDANTINAIFTRLGKPANTTRFVVSRDTQVLTVTATGTLPDGRALDDRLVYDRQALPGGARGRQEAPTTTLRGGHRRRHRDAGLGRVLDQPFGFQGFMVGTALAFVAFVIANRLAPRRMPREPVHLGGGARPVGVPASWVSCVGAHREDRRSSKGGSAKF